MNLYQWYCPFPLKRDVVQALLDSGGVPCAALQEETGWEHESRVRISGPLLALYRPPHEVLRTPTELENRYRRLKILQPAARLWRLDRLLNYHSNQWYLLASIGAAIGEPKTIHRSIINSIEACSTLAIMEEHPGILETYLELEWTSEITGSAIDEDYRTRLRRACTAQDLLKELEKQNELVRFREEILLLRGELEQTQQELAHHVRSHQHAQHLIKSQEAELERAVDLLMLRVTHDSRDEEIRWTQRDSSNAMNS